MLLVGGGMNSILKFGFQWPRPFWISGEVSGAVGATGFGFPSGHAQNAASIWGLLATSTKKKWGPLDRDRLDLLDRVFQDCSGSAFHP